MSEDAKKSTAPVTFEMELPASRLSNLAWSRLHELMGEELSKNGEHIESEPISEAEALLQFKKAISQRADFLLIRLRYET